MLVGFAYSLGWLNNHVSRVFIAHLLYHAERSQVLKVAAGFAISELESNSYGTKHSAWALLQEMQRKTKFTFSCSFPAIFESRAEIIFANFSSVCFSGLFVRLNEGGESGHRMKAA